MKTNRRTAAATSLFGAMMLLFLMILTARCGKQKDPTQPDNALSLVSTFPTPGYAHDVSVVEGYAFVADDQAGVRIIDISDPEAPFEVSTLGSDQSATNVEAIQILEMNRMALVADYDIGVLIYDIADIAHPQLLNIAFDRDVEGLFGLDGGDTIFVFAADRNEGFKVNRYEKQPGGTWNWFYYTFFKRIFFPCGEPLDVVATGRYAFVANDHIGVEVIDLTLPDSSAHLRTIDTPGAARAVSLHTDHVYVAAYQRGVQIVDVSDPGQAAIIGSYEEVDEVVDVFVLAGFAYVADRDEGLLVLDVSDPIQPSLAGWIETPYAQAVYATIPNGGSHIDIYVADRDWGLVIIRQAL